MANKVILFPHPGKEHTPQQNPNSIMDWNAKPWHARKFLHVKADYIDSAINFNNMQLSTNSDVTFWGEWEQPSKFIEILNPNNTNGYPKYIHEPIISNNAIFQHLKNGNVIDAAFIHQCEQFYDNTKQNTDPYVFGDNFYYSCCKQSFSAMRDLEKGDVIVFYSTMGKGTLEAFVDTVFVIGGRIEINGQKEYDYISVLKDLQEIVSPQYLSGVILPIIFGNQRSLNNGETPNPNVLYYSATYDNPVMVNNNRMFSYFPCKQLNQNITNLSQYTGFSRPLVWKRTNNANGYCTTINEIRETGDKINNMGIMTNIINNNTPNGVYNYWVKLTKYFMKNGYSLGVKAYEP